MAFTSLMNLLPWSSTAIGSNGSNSGSAERSNPPESMLPTQQHKLSEAQKRLYSLEKEENFRWIARLLSSPSTYTLSTTDLASSNLISSLDELGQYAEIAHGSIDPHFVWRNLSKLVDVRYPLEGYDALLGSELVSVFHGKVAGLQGYIAYRKITGSADGGLRDSAFNTSNTGSDGERSSGQLIVAFSGTSGPAQTLKDLDARLIAYPLDCKVTTQIIKEEEEEEENGDRTGSSRIKSPTLDKHSDLTGATVHAGFWSIFTGLKDVVYEELSKAFNKFEVDELVLTGHSLGGTQAFLFAMELMKDQLRRPDPSSPSTSATTSPVQTVSFPPNLMLKVATFGCPRIGNASLVNFYNSLTKKYKATHSFQDYAVKGYNDGVHCLPPKALGYRHIARSSSFYFYHGNLYKIPPSESEYSVFPVRLEPDSLPPEYPLGGHNYYNNRDMEKTQRYIKWLDIVRLGEKDWEDRYLLMRNKSF